MTSAQTCGRSFALAAALVLASPGGPFAAEPVNVDDVIKAMTTTLTAATSISVHVEKTFDEMTMVGLKVQYSGAIDLAIRRPDRFQVSYGDDMTAKDAWYNGTELVIVDYERDVYGKLEAEDTIEATLDAVSEKYGVTMPLAELFSKDVQDTITARTIDSYYVGLHDVGGAAAHHMLFVGEAAEWQVWVAAEGTPLLLKMVINRDLEPGEPQQTFVFSDWDLAADLPDEVFAPVFPEGASLAAFLPRKGE